jgi:hypothetical protein
VAVQRRRHVGRPLASPREHLQRRAVAVNESIATVKRNAATQRHVPPSQTASAS